MTGKRAKEGEKLEMLFALLPFSKMIKEAKNDVHGEKELLKKIT